MKRLVLSLTLSCSVACGAFAQEPPPAEETQLLNCRINEHLPPEPALAAEGGYGFQYQSIEGVTEDARACTLYRLRNTPDKPPTPVRWTLGEEILMDKTRLARCPADVVTCPWVNVAKYFEGSVATNLSQISYGLNADAYAQQVETFMSNPSPGSLAEAQSIGTEIQGVFASAAGEPVDVHLIVKSRVELDAGGRQVAVLEITDLGGEDALASGLLRIAWTALEGVAEAAAVLREASPGDLAGIVFGEEAEGQLDGAPEGFISRRPGTFEVAFPMQAYMLQRNFQLTVFYRDETEPLISVEMPAFIPDSTPQ